MHKGVLTFTSSRNIHVPFMSHTLSQTLRIQLKPKWTFEPTLSLCSSRERENKYIKHTIQYIKLRKVCRTGNEECYEKSKIWKVVENAGGWELRYLPTHRVPQHLGLSMTDGNLKLLEGNWYKKEIYIISGGLKSNKHPQAVSVRELGGVACQDHLVFGGPFQMEARKLLQGQLYTNIQTLDSSMPP